MRSATAIGSAALVVLALGGCGGGGVADRLRAAGIAQTPDEFLVLPTRPLEMPQDLAALPPPTPGAVNRVDYQPRPEAIAGLTGRPGIATANGAALVASAGPADPAIRPELAAEDAEWRATHRGLLLERWFSRDREQLIYRDMQLDAGAEFERMRAQGVRVPPAPPSVINPEG
jgi:hypothetical protein